MVFLHVTIQVKRRKLKEWSENFEKIVLPILSEHGQKLVGAWKTTIGVYDEVLHLYAFESLGEMEKIRKKVWADPKMLDYMSGPSLVGLEVSKTMEPLSYSPLC